MPLQKYDDKRSEKFIARESIKKNEANLNFKLTIPIYEMNDLILEDSISNKIWDVISLYKNSNKIYEEWGLGDVIKNKNKLFVNLYGESGTGKTMTAHAIAKALNKKMICVNYSEIESKYVGETSKNLNRLFETGLIENAIILFDEADAMLSKRVTDMSNSTDVSVNQTRSVLLGLMNEYNGMIIFTTNFISNFDKAFMRRINYHIRFDFPNEKLRLKLWKMYIPHKMPTNANVNELAIKYDKITGSDISNAILIASIRAARGNHDLVENTYIEEAIESIIESKNANSVYDDTIIQKRIVSEEYALNNIYKKE